MPARRPRSYCLAVAIRRLLSDRLDVAIVAALAALFLLEVVAEPAFAGDRPIAVPAGLAFFATLAWRRRWPLLPLAAGLGIIELSNVAAPQLAETAAFLFGVVITFYSAGAYSDGRTTIAAAVLVAVAIPAAAIEPGSPVLISDIGFFVMFFGGPFVAGRVMRRRRASERALAGRAEAAQRDAEERARAAVAEERARIARELHDVVAHSVSVMLLQARGARRVLGEDQEPAREALGTIERSGRQALDEMRRMLSVLRLDGEEASLSPQPSLRRVDELADSVRAAGLPVKVTVEGDIGDLPPGLDVSAYRIVQEGLTNALKHAGPAEVRVAIRRRGEDGGELEIEVVDDGAGTADPNGAGHGLVGMRERVAIYGGHLEAGREPGGGFALRARLPLGPAR